MIGDWVMLYGRPRKVERIYDYGRVEVDCIEEDCDELEPIPLTPKILEKNGFSQDPLNGHIFVFQEKSGEVIYYECGPKYGLTIDNQLATIQDLKINYVHQLQNALRLCGIEKEIVV